MFFFLGCVVALVEPWEMCSFLRKRINIHRHTWQTIFSSSIWNNDETWNAKKKQKFFFLSIRHDGNFNTKINVQWKMSLVKYSLDLSEIEMGSICHRYHKVLHYPSFDNSTIFHLHVDDLCMCVCWMERRRKKFIFFRRKEKKRKKNSRSVKVGIRSSLRYAFLHQCRRTNWKLCIFDAIDMKQLTVCFELVTNSHTKCKYLNC